MKSRVLLPVALATLVAAGTGSAQEREPAETGEAEPAEIGEAEPAVHQQGRVQLDADGNVAESPDPTKKGFSGRVLASDGTLRIALDGVADDARSTGEPVPGIAVSLEQLPGGFIAGWTRTDESGAFRFGPVPAGEYRLVVSRPVATASIAVTEEGLSQN